MRAPEAQAGINQLLRHQGTAREEIMIACSLRQPMVSASLAVVLFVIGGCAPNRDADASSAPPGLIGVEWRLAELTGKPVIPTAGDEQPYVKFHDSDSKFEGFTGCNRINDTYSLVGSELRLDGPVAMTRMACLDQRLNAQEQTLAQVLGEMNRYRITGEELTIYGGRGELASFVPASGDSSSGTDR